MIQGKVLVTGATGDTGGATVEELLSRGHRVRALAHRQDERSKQLQERGVEVVFGDLLDFGRDARRAEGRAAGLLLLPHSTGHRPGNGPVRPGREGGRRRWHREHVTDLAREDAKSHAATDHWLAERVFDWSGVTVAHIRPTYFAEWLLYLAPMIRAGLLHVPFGTGRHAPIVAEDQARVIVCILEDPASHRGKIYPLYGPVEFTYQEIAQVLSRVLGKDVQYKQVSFETMLQMMASGAEKRPAEHSARALYGEFEQPHERRTGDSFLIQHLREVAIDHQNGIFAGTNDLVEKIGGRPPMTLEEFIAKHRKAFE